jgi:hypothetical protein
MHVLIGLGVVAAGAVGYAAYKHYTLAQVKAEVLKIEAEAVADVKSVIARIKAVL